MGSESDVATDWKTDLIIGKNFNFENPCLLEIRTSFMDDPLSMEYVSINDLIVSVLCSWGGLMSFSKNWDV